MSLDTQPMRLNLHGGEYHVQAIVLEGGANAFCITVDNERGQRPHHLAALIMRASDNICFAFLGKKAEVN